MHSEDAHFTGVPDNTNSPGSQEPSPQFAALEEAWMTAAATKEKGFKFSRALRRCALHRSPGHEQSRITRTPDIKNGIDCACLRSYIRQILPISPYCTFSFPELRSSWPAPRIESSGRFQFNSPRFTDFRSFCAVSISFQNGGPSQVSYTRR